MTSASCSSVRLPAKLRIAVLRFSPTIMLWVRVTTQANADESSEKEIARSLASFRAMSQEEAQAVKPLHVNVVRVAPGETVETLAARMSVADRPCA